MCLAFRSSLHGLKTIALRILISTLLFLMGIGFSLWNVPVQASDAPLSLTYNLLVSGDISDQITSPNGSHVVYLIRQTENGPANLFSVPTAGGLSVKLNMPLTNNQSASLFYITPDSSRVIFLVGTNATYNFHMYSVPIVGGTVRDLGVQFSDTSWMHKFTFTSDSDFAVFSTMLVSDLGKNLAKTLNSVSVDGSLAATRLVSVTNEAEMISDWALTNDNRYVVYTAGKTQSYENDLFRIDIQEGEPLKLSGDREVEGSVHRIFPAPSGQYVVYFTHNPLTQLRNLISVSIAGGVRNKINPEPTQQPIFRFFLPDSDSFVYSTLSYTPDAYGNSQHFDDFYRLIRTTIKGDSQFLLSSTVDTVGTHSKIDEARFLRTNQLVMYSIDTFPSLGRYVYTVPIDGGAKTRLAGPLKSQNPQEVFAVSSDQSTLIYEGYDFQTDSQFLHATSVTVSQPITIHHFTGYGYIITFTPDSAGVVYWVKESKQPIQINGYELIYIPIIGGEATKLNIPLNSTQSVSWGRKSAIQLGAEICVVYGIGPLNTLYITESIHSSCYVASSLPTPTRTATPMPTQTPTVTPFATLSPTLVPVESSATPTLFWTSTPVVLDINPTNTATIFPNDTPLPISTIDVTVDATPLPTITPSITLTSMPTGTMMPTVVILPIPRATLESTATQTPLPNQFTVRLPIIRK